MVNREISVNDEQEQDERILIVVRMKGGTPEVMTPVGNEVMLKLVVINDDADNDEENALAEDYLSQFNLTHVYEISNNDMRNEIEE